MLNKSLIYLAKKLNFTKSQTAALDSSVGLQGQINKLFTFLGLLSAEETNSVPCSGIVKVILTICRYCKSIVTETYGEQNFGLIFHFGLPSTR